MLLKNKEKIGYVRYNDRKYECCIEKILNIIRKIFIKIVVEYIENGIIILIPKYKKNKKIVNKIIEKQIDKYILKNQVKYLVFEEELKNFQNYFYECEILNGKYLMKNSILNILKYIFLLKNKNINLENIYVFVNEYNKENLELIKILVNNFKTVNIITENIKRFKILENFLYNDGILITISNNRRKAAKNAEYIINIDFEKEKFEKYNIKMDCIIINLTKELQFFDKLFRGILINNFEINFNKNDEEFCEEFFGKINKKIFLESILINKNFKKIQEYYIENSVEITGLIGKRGKINECEFFV